MDTRRGHHGMQLFLPVKYAEAPAIIGDPLQEGDIGQLVRYRTGALCIHRAIEIEDQLRPIDGVPRHNPNVIVLHRTVAACRAILYHDPYIHVSIDIEYRSCAIEAEVSPVTGYFIFTTIRISRQQIRSR